MADGRVQVDGDKITEKDIARQDYAGAEDNAAPEPDALSDQDGRVDKGDERGVSLDQRLHQPGFGRRLAESAEIDALRIWLMPAQGSHRRETSEGLERIRVVIEEAGERPLNTVVRVT